MAELLLKTRDTLIGRDGEVLCVRPDGFFVTPVECLAWIDDGTEPLQVATWPGRLQRLFRQRIAELRWKLHHTDAEVDSEYDLPEGTAKFDRQLYKDDRAKFVTLGFDTNWGWEDRRAHAPVRMSDLTLEEVESLLEWDYVDDHLGTIQYKRRKIVPYWDHLDAAKVADLRNSSLYVTMDRVTALDKSIIQDSSRARRGMA